MRGPRRWDRLDAAAVAACWLFAGASSAHAYLDPGTGSALLYLITGLLLSAWFALRGLYYKIVEGVFRVRFTSQKCTLAVHSEDPRYETTFMPVLRALAEANVPFSYFTMYERGSSFDPLPAQATHHAIPPGLVGYSYLNHLEAKLLVTTTPQIDVMMFRRSKRVRHYCMVQHALGESRFVRPFAYDFFDSVLCCGPLVRQNIRKIEGIRRLPAKQLYETGIPHYDILVRKVRERAAELAPERSGRDRKLVLVAPSWGPMSLFTRFGVDFLRGIAERHDVLVRPHPQMRVSQPDIYQQVLELKGVTVDTMPTPIEAMARADIVVSDISGIAYEFAFIRERPVVIVDYPQDVGGLEGALLGNTTSLRELCSEFVIAVPQDEIGRLVDHVDRVMREVRLECITEARDTLVHNFGNAGGVAAHQIQELLRCL